MGSETIRLYDIRSYDSVRKGVGSKVIRINVGNNQDRRCQGPFATWTILDPEAPKDSSYWTSLKFTNDGQHILITTSGNTHYLIHAFQGRIVKRLVGNTGSTSRDQQNGGTSHRYGEEVGLSPDAKYAFAGGRDGVVRVWDLLDKNDPNDPAPMMNAPVMTELHSRENSPSPIRVLGFNPAYMMMVSGGNQLVSGKKKTTLSPGLSPYDRKIPGLSTVEESILHLLIALTLVYEYRTFGNQQSAYIERPYTNLSCSVSLSLLISQHNSINTVDTPFK